MAKGYHLFDRANQLRFLVVKYATAQFEQSAFSRPTWCSFRLQFYCNGHNWLASHLRAEGIAFSMADNAFVRVTDIERAQQLADSLKPDELHRRLDRYAVSLSPVGDVFGQTYHWSIMQVEYSTDLIFRSETILGPLYEHLAREAVLAVKAPQVASFLSKTHRITFHHKNIGRFNKGRRAFHPGV